MSKVYLFLLSVVLTTSCSDHSSTEENTQSENDSTVLAQALNQQADDEPANALSTLKDSLITRLGIKSEYLFNRLSADMGKLNESLDSLSKNASQDTLDKTRLLWKETHDTYIATRLFRQLAQNLGIFHPVFDNAQSSPDLVHTLHSRIDQHPLLPGYLDSVQGYPYSGLIHSEIELTEENLNTEHLLGDPAYIALGFHALEFMIFGEENLPRNINDLLVKKQDSNKERKLKQRRLQYIQLLGELLMQDIEIFTNAWNPVKGFYFSTLASKSPSKLSTSLQQIAEVELEACAQIKGILDKPSNQAVHDSPESIRARITLANSVLELLDSNDRG
jgi:hypothetical protein